jgi:hypothetical protein
MWISCLEPTESGYPVYKQDTDGYRPEDHAQRRCNARNAANSFTQFGSRIFSGHLDYNRP